MTDEKKHPHTRADVTGATYDAIDLNCERCDDHLGHMLYPEQMGMVLCCQCLLLEIAEIEDR